MDKFQEFLGSITKEDIDALIQKAYDREKEGYSGVTKDVRALFAIEYTNFTLEKYHAWLSSQLKPN